MVAANGACILMDVAKLRKPLEICVRHMGAGTDASIPVVYVALKEVLHLGRITFVKRMEVAEGVPWRGVNARLRVQRLAAVNMEVARPASRQVAKRLLAVDQIIA
mmetsp:Transcript_9005/g.17756  ORF Transcript_9005/g.17756 Transcript_9005/m.17756 type:complete len:105 (+) Transcript_9005:822-1136(+)